MRLIVELSLFCTVYNDKLWDINPMKADNNSNGVGKGGRRSVHRQGQRIDRISGSTGPQGHRRAKDYDNVYYEICNEPYFGGVTKKWNDRIAAVIVDAEKDFPARHLIAQNISNGSAKR